MVKVFSLTITLLITLFFLLILPNQISAATITCGGNDYDSATACPQGYQFQCNNNTPTCVNTTTCSTPTLSVEIPGSGIKINNEDPAITDSIYVSASGSCSIAANAQYFFRLRYYDDAAKRWYTQSETEWQTSNNTGFSLNSGIREYFVEVFMPNGNSTTVSGSYFYKMDKTSSVDSTYITSTSAPVRWGLRMNYYSGLVPPGFYLLFGKDPAISTNRQPTTDEIYPGYGSLETSSLDLTNYRATYIGYYPLSNLTPDTTYYWRIRGDHPGVADSYFAGGSFKTLPVAPPPIATTKDATDISYNSATLNGEVNPNGEVTSPGFRYSTTDPGTCNNTFGNQVGQGGIPAGNTTVPYSIPIQNLVPDATYYFCAVAANRTSLGYGSIMKFKTLVAPASACSGNISLYLFPNSTVGGTFVEPSTGGLFGICSGKTINFKKGPCTAGQECVDVGSCQSGFSGCTGPKFKAPDNIGTYTYSALIDKNGNGNTSDTGESASTDLIVTSVTPPGGGGPPPATSVTTCGAEGLELLEGLLTTPGQPVFQSSADSSKFKCIIDPKAAFAPFKIPGFDDLKSLYYDQK